MQMVADVYGCRTRPAPKPLFHFCQPVFTSQVIRSVTTTDQKYFCFPLPDAFPISVRSAEALGLFLIFFQIVKKKENKRGEEKNMKSASPPESEALVVCANSIK